MLLALHLNALLGDAPVLVEVPDVVGETQAAGTATLEGAGFVVAVETAYSSTVAAGLIISQSPAGGIEYPEGGTVTITVSLGEAPVADQTVTGGWWPDYEHTRRQRDKRRREIEELEAEAERIADATAREIYLLERKLEAEEAERADLARLQKLADQYAHKLADMPKPLAVAVWNAQDARSRNALEQMRRVAEQEQEFELLAVQQIVLLLLN